tara:strand:+ start:529 stop:1281 length:753 start_codon:yes stop_codon:yes gene_type:complete
MYLIGDIGNTETKIFLFNEKLKLKKKWTISSISLKKTYLDSKIKLTLIEISKIKKILFSSVVPNTFQLIKKFLIKKNKKLKIYELKQIDLKKLIKLKVNRKQVGSDRIANAIGVMSNNQNYIVIDFGTATTFDVIIDKTYLGGVIAPGVKLSLENLSNKASLIPKIKLSKISNVIGTNTSEAVKSGFFWGYLGLIDNIIKLIKKQSRKQFKIVLTGGLSHLFKNTIKGKSVIEKDLTITGLKKVIIKLIK